MAQKPITILKKPVQNPHNVQLTKYYIFNETGNIMVASTVDGNAQIETSVQDVFAEVAVFFASMTRAISQTPDPNTPAPHTPYSIYNYEALSNIISGSGLFVHVTEEDIEYSTETVGIGFSKELIERLLGLATGAGELAFAQGMITSMGKAGLQINQSSTSASSKIANIVFVCEYLSGMPIISAIVVYADSKTVAQSFSIGPCFKEHSTQTSMDMHKDTYLFVTPSSLKKYAPDLLTAESNVYEDELVNWLQELVERTPAITGVYTTGSAPEAAPSELDIGTPYLITGRFFGQATSKTKQKIAFSGKPTGVPITVSDWGPSEIVFTVGGTSGLTTISTIEVTLPDGKTILNTPAGFTVKKPS